MLNTFPAQSDDKAAEQGVIATDVLWLDLLNPTGAEATNLEKTVGATLPSLGALSEIETSSRLRNHGGVLYMSTPSAARRPEGAQATPPFGFVLSADRLITVRFMPLPAFDAVAGKFATSQDAPKSSLEVFTLLCEEIVDRVADILEHLAGELNDLSVDAYADEYACDWSGGALKPRLASLRQDIHSLIDYEEQLASKVQFVLDALVGLIGIAQNDVFKVLTIVSIVGIPPTLMAGIYGMNFKSMPEYDWAWGYLYGWAVILLSTVIPLVWFKVKGWF